MDYNIDKMIYNISCFGEIYPLKYFKQFTVYQNIQIFNKKINIHSIEYTTQSIEIYSLKLCDTKIIDTVKGTSLEGQHLSGKKLIIVGNISMSLILNYENNKKKRRCNKVRNKAILNVVLPFSTFIVIPRDINDNENVNIRYFIEDISLARINQKKVLISVTMIMQYLD